MGMAGRRHGGGDRQGEGGRGRETEGQDRAWCAGADGAQRGGGGGEASAASRAPGAHLVWNVLCLERLPGMQEAAENLSLCYCFLLTSALRSQCELYDPEF